MKKPELRAVWDNLPVEGDQGGADHGDSAAVSDGLPSPPVDRRGRRFVLSGRVQGLGVRPTICRLACEQGLGGVVQNTSRGVEIEVEGSSSQVSHFSAALPASLPPGTVLEDYQIEEMVPVGRDTFTIIQEPSAGPLQARVPPDIGVCSACLQEINDPRDRRFGYPFTSCTLCGPRYTIVGSMPYERADTTMSAFSFCSPCRDEYTSSGDRRFHAQTDACHDCGPQVWYTSSAQGGSFSGPQALDAAIRAVRAGKILAVRGLGGYQLLVDATHAPAVERLRQRKGRPTKKPLAVMVESVEAAERLAVFDATECQTLSAAENPILLVRAKQGSDLAPGVHPDLDTVGLLLPTTPLHALLLRGVCRPLVCTSGNRDGDPLEYQVDQAEQHLSDLCDAFLHHNREIARPIDDSVVRVIAGRPVTLRLARGLAPLALDLPAGPAALAVGGHQKSAFAWSNGAQAVLGPHVGDQQGFRARQRFLEQIQETENLYQFRAEQLVHDLHPEYFSTHWAQQQRPAAMAVQHHYAHVLAGMLEHGWLDREVLGVAWDGTGYGTDGTIWGGEFLLATATQFQRFARLRPFRLPGAEAAIREPWRAAVAILGEVVEPARLAPLSCWQGRDIHPVQQIAGNPKFSPLTTSAGRLFDAAAAIVLGLARADFDGQPAMRLEAVADRSAQGRYPLPLREGKLLELDWRALFAGLLVDCEQGVAPGVISMRFHRTLAAGIAAICRRVCVPAVFTGGVFQNRLLTELLREQLIEHQQPLGWPGKIPPNDGGLAAGQLAFMARQGTI